MMCGMLAQQCRRFPFFLLEADSQFDDPILKTHSKWHYSKDGCPLIYYEKLNKRSKILVSKQNTDNSISLNELVIKSRTIR